VCEIGLRGKKMAIAEFSNSIVIVMFVAASIGIANVCLLLGLLHAYWKTYKELKSEFTIGLLYFTSFLLLQNILSTIFIVLPLIVPVEFLGSELGGPRLPLFMINLVQFIALAMLYKITRK
jgi:hypothetical protein